MSQFKMMFLLTSYKTFVFLNLVFNFYIMKYFFLILILLLAINTKAQGNQANIGIKGGFNFSTFAGADGLDVSRRISFNAGLMLESKLSNSISLQPEVVFSSQGSKVNFGSEAIENRLDYLNLPILLRFYVSDGFSFDVGPQLGILVSAKQGSSSRKDIDIKSNYSGTDIGLATGINYKFVSGFNLSARYNFGLKNIINTNIYTSSDTIKNGVFQISIGYYFKNKK